MTGLVLAALLGAWVSGLLVARSKRRRIRGLYSSVDHLRIRLVRMEVRALNAEDDLSELRGYAPVIDLRSRGAR